MGSTKSTYILVHLNLFFMVQYSPILVVSQTFQAIILTLQVQDLIGNIIDNFSWGVVPLIEWN